MKNKRSLRFLAVLGVFSLVAAACGDGDDTTATTEAPAEATTTEASGDPTTTEAMRAMRTLL